MHIIITGANSGLGMALAKYYARNGVILGLTARNITRLEEIANICRDKGAEVRILSSDIRDFNIINDWLEKFPKIDIFIANAGVSGGVLGGSENIHQTKEILTTNIDGVIYPCLKVIELMQKNTKKGGNIAIISSMAGIRGLPSAPAYSTSKSAIYSWTESMRGLVFSDNIYISLIIPAYIKTPMTDANNFPMPLIIDAQKAACIIAKGIKNKKSVVAFPLIIYILLKIITILPAFLMDKIFAKLPKKQPLDKNK